MHAPVSRSPRTDPPLLPATAAAVACLLPPDTHHLPPGPSFAPEPGQHPLGGRPGRGRLAPELRVEPDGGDDLAGLEAGGQVFGEGGVIEWVPGEPVPEAAERTLVGAPGVRADRSGGEFAGRLPDGQGPLSVGVPFECGSHLCPASDLL